MVSRIQRRPRLLPHGSKLQKPLPIQPRSTSRIAIGCRLTTASSSNSPAWRLLPKASPTRSRNEPLRQNTALQYLPKVISEMVGQTCRLASIPRRESPPFRKLLLATDLTLPQAPRLHFPPL